MLMLQNIPIYISWILEQPLLKHDVYLCYHTTLSLDNVCLNYCVIRRHGRQPSMQLKLTASTDARPVSLS